jgi:hypothetical protein
MLNNRFPLPHLMMTKDALRRLADLGYFCLRLKMLGIGGGHPQKVLLP